MLMGVSSESESEERDRFLGVIPPIDIWSAFFGGVEILKLMLSWGWEITVP